MNNSMSMIIPVLSPEWKVEVTFRLTGPIIQGHCSLFHLTQGGNFENYGDRVPAAFVYDPQLDLKVRSDLNGIPNGLNAPVLKISRNTTYHLEVNQRYISAGNYRLSYLLNGENIISVINQQAEQFYGVRVYSGGTPWYQTCSGTIKNFKITNFL